MQAPTAAQVDLLEDNNVTMQDAFQFGTVGDTSWSFAGQTFKMEVKASRDDVAPLVTWTSGAGQILMLDSVQRILQFNVTSTAILAALPVGQYVYDLLMIDGSVPPIRTKLMFGNLYMNQGITED